MADHHALRLRSLQLNRSGRLLTPRSVSALRFFGTARSWGSGAQLPWRPRPFATAARYQDVPGYVSTYAITSISTRIPIKPLATVVRAGRGGENRPL
jgi:hypothetical protein